MKHEKKRYGFILEAVQPIAHMEENIGNQGVMRRKRVRQPDGEFADVPYVSANAMRNRMRQAASYAFLDAAGILGESLTEAAVRLLFSGGTVTGKGDGSNIRLDEYRELAELLPTVALFGGCIGNTIMPGRITVDDLTLLCEESLGQAPGWATDFVDGAGGAALAAAHVEEAQRVRMDPLLQPSKRMLLTAGDQRSVSERLLAREAASEAGDHIAAEEAKSSMMPHTFERVCQGSLFSWRCEAHCYSDLDVDVFNVAVAAFLYDPKVGGRVNSGHGQLRAVHATHGDVPRFADAMQEVDTKALGGKFGDIFRAHVAEHADAIRTTLQKVAA